MEEATTTRFEPDVADRMFAAVRAVRLRLDKATTALNDAKVPYAVIGAHAVAHWVELAAPGAGRNTPDVDLLLRREDLDAAKRALSDIDFYWHFVPSPPVVVNGKWKTRRGDLQVVFSGETVHSTDPFAAPDVTEVEFTGGFWVLRLDALVRMKVLANRRIDKVHLLDLIGAGAIDYSWLNIVPPDLSPRLRELLDNPNS